MAAVDDDLDRLCKAWKRDRFKIDASTDTFFSFSEWRNKIEKYGYRLFWLNARARYDDELVLKTCGDKLVAYRITLRCLATTKQEAKDQFEKAAVKIFSPDGKRLGYNRKMPKTYNGVTFYFVKPRIDEIDHAARPQPFGDGGNFWAVSTEFDLTFNIE